MLDGIRIATKIPVAIIGIAALVGIGIGVQSYRTADTKFEHLAENRLITATDTAKTEMLALLTRIQNQLRLTAEHPGTAEAVTEFSAAWQQMRKEGKDPKPLLQRAYITLLMLDGSKHEGRLVRLDHECVAVAFNMPLTQFDDLLVA